MQKDCTSWILRVVCLAVALTATGCTTPVILQQRVVEAEKIILKDATGKVRLQIAIDEEGGISQTFFDAKGTERLKLMVDAENVTRQRFYDETGAVRMGSYVYPANHAKSAKFVGTDIVNKDNKRLLTSHVDTEGVAHQEIFDDKSMAPRVMSYAYPTDHPQTPGLAGIGIYNKEGNLLINSSINGSGRAQQMLLDETGKVRWDNVLRPVKDPDYQESIVMTFYNKRGQGLIQSDVDKAGVARQRFLNEKGKVRLWSYSLPPDHDLGEQAGIGILDKDSHSAIDMASDKSGDTYQIFYGSNGSQRLALNVLHNGLVNQIFRDEAGTPRALTYTNAGQSGFNLYDTKSNLRFNTTTFKDGSLVQGFLSETGKDKASTTVESSGTVTHYLEKGALEQIWDNRAYIMMGIDILRSLSNK